jgi:hypothetical protein
MPNVRIALAISQFEYDLCADVCVRANRTTAESSRCGTLEMRDP